MGKRDIDSNMAGGIASGKTIKNWYQDVIKSDRRRVGVVVLVQKA